MVASVVAEVGAKNETLFPGRVSHEDSTKATTPHSSTARPFVNHSLLVNHSLPFVNRSILVIHPPFVIPSGAEGSAVRPSLYNTS
jgi:hypothetical protein